jgi:hypothetical protein
VSWLSYQVLDNLTLSILFSIRNIKFLFIVFYTLLFLTQYLLISEFLISLGFTVSTSLSRSSCQFPFCWYPLHSLLCGELVQYSLLIKLNFFDSMSYSFPLCKIFHWINLVYHSFSDFSWAMSSALIILMAYLRSLASNGSPILFTNFSVFLVNLFHIIHGNYFKLI